MDFRGQCDMDERPVRTEVKPGELWAEGLIRACVRLALRKLKSGSWGRKGVEVRLRGEGRGDVI